MFRKRKKIKIAKQTMKSALTWREWYDAAGELDELENNNKWKFDQKSKLYDADLMLETTLKLVKQRTSNDIFGLIQTLEEGLSSLHHDAINPLLYTVTYTGESQNIPVNFLNESVKAINYLCDVPISGYSTQDKLDHFKRAFRTFGRSALMLSGGATMGIYHLGVVKAMFEHHLLPKVIAGSSMGAIVAAGVCSRNEEEVKQFFSSPDKINNDAMKFKNLKRIFDEKSLFDPPSLLKHIIANMGSDMTFKEAYERTGWILNISVSPTRSRQKPKILNYLTSPDLFISHSTLVSCSMPFLYAPGMLVAKGEHGEKVPYLPTERWIDGTLGGDVPMARVSRIHNVNHYIVSQTNPHIYPLISKSEKPSLPYMGFEIVGSMLRSQARSLLSSTGKYIGNEKIKMSLDQLHAITAQPYVGDINIHPKLDPWMLRKVVSNPTKSDIEKFILEGERVTWPKIAMIHDSTLISSTLEKVISKLENRITSENI